MVKFIDLNKAQVSKLTFNQPGDYLVFFYNLSGKFLFDIKVPQVNLNIYGLFLGQENEQYLVETIQHHQAPSSSSNLFIKGVFYDSSKFHYQGLIRIEKEAQKSKAYQKNQNLILSPYCFVESKPYLEILANDVFCTHGSTTGRVNQQQLFYLASRSLNENQGKLLLIHGFVNEIFNKMREMVDFSLFQKTFLEVENLLNFKVQL